MWLLQIILLLSVIRHFAYLSTLLARKKNRSTLQEQIQRIPELLCLRMKWRRRTKGEIPTFQTHNFKWIETSCYDDYVMQVDPESVIRIYVIYICVNRTKSCFLDISLNISSTMSKWMDESLQKPCNCFQFSNYVGCSDIQCSFADRVVMTVTMTMTSLSTWSILPCRKTL